MSEDLLLERVRDARARLRSDGPPWSRPIEQDFERVSVGHADCDALRDALVAESARVVIEIGLAYGSTALAIGEAILVGGDLGVHRQVVIDPFQASQYRNAGWETLHAAGLAGHCRLMAQQSSLALPRLQEEGVVADAAFVDGSHRFHEVFVDLYFLRKLVRPGGLVVLDDVGKPSVGSALRYFDLNLGWTPVPIGGHRLTARRLPHEVIEPPFNEFVPFIP